MELLRLIKQKYPKLPVIIFTAMGDDEALHKEALAAGADGFMCKTHPLPELFNEVARHLPPGTAP